VAGNIVRQHALGEPGLGVYFEGTAKLLKTRSEQGQAFKYLHQRLQTSQDALEEAGRPDGHKFYKITVETYYVFGSLNGQPSQKYTLLWHGGSH
jgi:hypothetical protein